VSNYARPGEESRHNLAYWEGRSYLGIGAGAHGRLQDASGQWHATAGLKPPERWLTQVEACGHGLESDTPLASHERREELLLSGLRLRKGIPLETLHPILNQSRLAQFEDMALLSTDHGQLRLTGRGTLLTERIALELLAA
jgi:oxygen-independent coproporphyrinogen-3 oxidase